MANILVIGSGGREHALCWKLKASPSVTQVFCAPGNGGISEDAVCVPISQAEDIIRFCNENHIVLVIIGPEQPLVEGLADRLSREGLNVFGPSKAAARLEGSKGFTKTLCKKYGIPTADYGFFTNAEAAHRFLRDKTYPIVIKADGLAAGKGVIIANSQKEAHEAIDSMLGGMFGESGKSIVIEEFLEGEEVSFFALCDGENAVEFGYAQDHKRAFDGDKGPNTGGMGTYAPSPLMTPALRRTVMGAIIQPTLAAMKKEGCPFKGVLFAGLILTQQGPKLLEYNVRFGDPETQVLMARFSGDLYPVLLSCCKGGVEKANISFRDAASVCVVMASNGYPGDYGKGSEIKNLSKAGAVEGVKIFHAGTEQQNGRIMAVGGRVLGITALKPTIVQAQTAAYKAINLIDWPEGFCRRDIAARAIATS